MNTNTNVVSVPTAVDLAGKEHIIVKLSSTGVTPATTGDIIVGTVMRAQPYQIGGFVAGKYPVDVALKDAVGLHYALLGATTAAIATGDTLALDPANPGYLVPSNSNVVAVSWDASTGAFGAWITVKFI